jgi:hypothetical protein
MVRFAVADDDRPVLDDLVQYFGNGNRSAYLRATLTVMRSVKLAEQSKNNGHSTDAADGVTIDTDADARVLDGRT